MDWIADLSLFHSDRCWQFVLLARSAPVGVILRRGPSKWWHLTLWDTRRDAFTGGQWFHGSLYPEKCDLAPDGSLLSYFACKFQSSARERGYDRTWRRYLGGQARFFDDGSLHVGTHKDAHPEHPPGPLRVVPHSYLKLDDPFLRYPPWANTGWMPVPLPGKAKKESYFDPLLSGWRKSVGRLCLSRAVDRGEDPFPSRRRSQYKIHKLDGQTQLAQFEAHWADFDQSGRLEAAAGGRILEGRIDRHHGLQWRQLAAFQDGSPERIAAPEWAHRW